MGDILHEVDSHDVKSMGRKEILELLQGASSMQMRCGVDSVRGESHHDPQTGLEVSRLGKVLLKWSDPPVDVAKGDVLHRLDDRDVMGMTRQEIEALAAHGEAFAMLDMRKMAAAHVSPLHRPGLLQVLKERRLPVHFGSKCAGCQASPLIGARLVCKRCPDVQYCGACFLGRGHAHLVGHGFSRMDYPGSVVVDAKPPPPV